MYATSLVSLVFSLVVASTHLTANSQDPNNTDSIHLLM